MITEIKIYQVILGLFKYLVKVFYGLPPTHCKLVHQFSCCSLNFLLCDDIEALILFVSTFVIS